MESSVSVYVQVHQTTPLKDFFFSQKTTLCLQVNAQKIVTWEQIQR